MTDEVAPFIIDTDMAADDWMAILYLLQSPKADVKAITIAATGEAHAGPGVRNALRLLALTNQTEVVVSSGRTKPLRGQHKFPLSWRIAMDLRLGLSLPSSRQRKSKQQGVELITQLIQTSPQKVVLVTLGPLTNIAEVLETDPAIVDKLKMIYIMGGALDVPGNIEVSGVSIKNRYAEWNIYIDPYATAIVFQSGAPITLVPLDATNRMPLSVAFYERFQASTPAANFVHRTLTRLKPLIKKNEYYFWDPLTAVVATHNCLATFQERPVVVNQKEGPESGRTVADPGGSLVRICTAVDQKEFESIFLETLNRSA